MPAWLTRAAVPLFVSARTMRRGYPKGLATCRWALDSGGFSELSLYGRWVTSPAAYVDEVRRWRDRLGGMDWAAIQDWMCEPFLTQKTGLDVAQHQIRTVRSFLTLTELAPEIPWAPVVQGWVLEDYLVCVEMYRLVGHELGTFPVVGVGSVCRRQGTAEAETILRTLSGMGLRCHAFGFKTQGLRRCADALESADSLAWSLDARKSPRMPGCTGHRNCANCIRWALRWRERLLQGIP